MSWAAEDVRRVTSVVTELGTNLLRFAKTGRLLIARRAHAKDIEVISVDEGPGFVFYDFLNSAINATVRGPKTGLSAVREASDDFAIHSDVPSGTVLVARIRSGPPSQSENSPFRLGAICVPAPYETMCGDGWASAEQDGSLTLLMADGLGHGPEAAKASQAATEVFSAHPSGDLGDLLQRVHGALKSTRGAVACILRVEGDRSMISYTGAGNIAGRVVSGISDRSVITQPGTVGLQIRKPVVSTLERPEYALVILHSDGIEMRWKAETIRPLLQKDPTLIAAMLFRNHTRHRDDVTIMVVQPKD